MLLPLTEWSTPSQNATGNSWYTIGCNVVGAIVLVVPLPPPTSGNSMSSSLLSWFLYGRRNAVDAMSGGRVAGGRLEGNRKMAGEDSRYILGLLYLHYIYSVYVEYIYIYIFTYTVYLIDVVCAINTLHG